MSSKPCKFYIGDSDTALDYNQMREFLFKNPDFFEQGINPEISTPKTDETKAEEQPLLEGVRDGGQQEEGREVRAELRPQEETKGEEEVTEQQIDQAAQKAGIKPKSLRDLYNINRELFGLDRIKSFASAVAMDRMVGAMAKRAGVTKEQMYGRLEFRKDTEQNVLKADNALFQGTVDGKPVTLRNLDVDVVNGFYSPIEKNLKEYGKDKIKAKDWLNVVGKGDEAVFTGVRAFLEGKDSNAMVSKQEILDYMKDNRVSVVEVVKGEAFEDKGFSFGKTTSGEYYFKHEGADIATAYGLKSKSPIDAFNSWVEDNGGIDEVSEFYGIPKEDFQINDIRQHGERNQETKFSQYQLEGEKENYKEVLVTLPSKSERKVLGWEKTSDVAIKLKGSKDVYIIKGGEEYNLSIDGEEVSWHSSLDEAKAEAEKRFSDNLLGTKQGDFKSSHFDEPNILVHLRMNTRTDADGKKVLFLEEIQSDWGQTGKKEGFKGQQDLTPIKIEDDRFDNVWSVGNGTIWQDGNVFDVRQGDKIKTFDNYSDAVKWAKDNNQEQNKIPTAPFVMDTNAWTKLGLKVALKEAVAQGADKIAWTTGEQQNERYSLEKQVDRIQWNPWGYGPKEKGRRTVSIDMPNGEVYGMDVDSNGIIARSTNKDTEGKRLDSVIGKEIADKIMSDERGDLSGDGLKLGGKGMKGFYGSMEEGTKGIVGGVAEKLFGQKVGDVKIKTGEEFADYNWTEDSDGIQVVEYKGERKEFDTEEEAQKYINEIKSGQSTQPSVDITPALRAEVERGLALFQRQQGQQAKGAMVAADGNFVIYALTDPNVSTPLHEMAHVFEHYLTDAERAAVQNWAGTKAWDTQTSEKFASGFEKYLAEGKAPTPALQKIFEKFKQWLTDIYNGITGSEIDIELNEQMRDIYAKMLGEDFVAPKPKPDAVQVESAAEVPVQPEARSGETVPQGQPQAEPEVAPQEGQAQEITGLDAIAAEFGKEVEKVVNPITKADIKAQEKVTNIAKDDDFSMPSEPEMKDKRKEIEEDFASAMKRVKDSFGDLWSQNLSIIYDPRREAQKLYNFHSALVNLGRQAIRLGISDVNAFAAKLGRRADRFLERAWKDAELSENGQPMIVNSVDDMLNSEYLKVAETYQKQYDDATNRKKPFFRALLDNLGKTIVDANYIAKRMLRDVDAKQAIIDKNLMSGASSRAQKQFSKFSSEIFGGLSKAEKILLNNIIQSRTIISIDTRFDSSGKKRIKHPGDTNKESHEIYLGQIEKDSPELFAKLMDRADKYFDAQKSLLKERLDEGRITIDSYNAMINNEYSPRVFLEYLIDDAESEMVTPLKKGVKNIDISSLSDGDINSLYHNAEWLLSTNTLATNRVVFHNRANRSLYEFAQQNPNNGLIEIQTPVGVNKQTGQPIYPDPKVGFQQIQYFEDGVRKSMLVPNEFAVSWSNNNPLMAPSFANAIRLGTGGAIKRAMVTGINPAFALANFPRDIAHSLFFTNAYSPVFPVAVGQMTKDLIRTAKDAWSIGSPNNKNSRYYQYLQEGGGMDFLSIQGRPFVKRTQIQGKYDKGIDALVSVLGYINNRTEVWIRLSIRDREIAKQTASFAKKNGRMPNAGKETDRIKRNATEKSRSQMDFSRGGTLAKALDNFIPYLNANVQGVAVSASYVKNNPGIFAFKAVQAIAIAAALAAYNMDKYEEDYEKIDAGEKSRNLIYMLPFTKKTKDGKVQRAYVRIPKAQSAQTVFAFGEIMGKIMTNRPLSVKDIDLLSKSLEGITPNIDPRNVPILDAMNTYASNYDRFLDREVWRGAKNIDPAAEYYEGRTPWLWRDLGEALSASPERLKEATGKLTSDPDNNIFWVIASEGYETLLKQLPEEERTQVNDMASTTLEKVLTPFEKKFLSYTKDYGEMEDIKKMEMEELTKNKLRNDTVKKYIKMYINNEKELGKVESEFNQWVKTQNVSEQDKSEMKTKFNTGVKFKDADNVFYKILNTKVTGVKANVFYNEWVKESKKGKEKDFKRKAIELKAVPKPEEGSEFWMEFDRLKKTYGNEQTQ